jgi:hypothetical protein
MEKEFSLSFKHGGSMDAPVIHFLISALHFIITTVEFYF